MNDIYFLKNRLNRWKYERDRIAMHNQNKTRDNLLLWVDRKIREIEQEIERVGNGGKSFIQ